MQKKTALLLQCIDSRQKEACLIMPKKISHMQGRETKLNREINTTTCNAKTCLYFGNINSQQKRHV